jgi:hypothetical protein
LTFESGSKLAQIEMWTFYNCFSLKSILIPRSTKKLERCWARYSGLRKVVFESALSLRMMIETDNVDLSDALEVKFVNCDCPLEFPGYYIPAGDGVNHLFRLPG